MTPSGTTPPIDSLSQAILTVWHSLRTGDIGAPFKTDREALQTIKAAADLIIPLPGGRRSELGRPLDYMAPSASHAAAYLLTLDLRGRYFQAPPSNVQELNDILTRRFLYRGQAHGWRLSPTRWRSAEASERAIAGLSAYLKQFMTDEDAPDLDIVGRLLTNRDAECLAQHYGIPTNLTDFTFDPVVAVVFAAQPSSPAADDSITLPGHGVVFASSLYRMGERFEVAFPPVRARRLYRQCGLFVNFGSNGANGPHSNAGEATVRAIESQTCRLFFPRQYPDCDWRCAIDLSHLLTADPFFQDVADAALSVSRQSSPPHDDVAAMSALISTRPPWFTAALDGGGIYTDDEILAIGEVLSEYTRMAAMLIGDDQTFLDPFVLNRLVATDERPLRAIFELAQFSGTSLGELAPMAAAIRDSLTLSARIVADYNSQQNSSSHP